MNFLHAATVTQMSSVGDSITGIMQTEKEGIISRTTCEMVALHCVHPLVTSCLSAEHVSPVLNLPFLLALLSNSRIAKYFGYPFLWKHNTGQLIKKNKGD